MHSPLSNFFLRPRSTRHRHRRSASSASSLLTLDISPSTSATTTSDPSSTPPPPAAGAPPSSEFAILHAVPQQPSPLISNSSSSSYGAADHQPSCIYAQSHPSTVHHHPAEPAAAHSPLETSSVIHRRPSFESNVNDFATPETAENPSFPGAETSSFHRRSHESPFPSPYSLNVPLSSSGAYLCTLTLANHASSLCLSAGLLYTGLDSGDVVVFKTPRLPECARFGIGNLPVKALLVTDTTIFSAHKDHKIRSWQRPDAEGTIYKLLQTLPSAMDYLRNLILSKRYIQIRRHHKRLWIQHVDTITAMAIDTASMLLYSASWDNTFKVWNLRTMRCTQSVKAHDDAINAIVVSSHSDNLIYTASADSTIKVWKKLSAQKLVEVTKLSGHGASVNAMVMKAETGILYSGGSDCCVNVWKRVSRKKMAWKLETTLRGHRQPVLCLAASGQLMSSGGADKMIRVWRRGAVQGSYTCLAILQGHNGPVKSIAMAVSTLRSCYVYSASLDGTTKVWSVLYDKVDHEQNTDIIIRQ